MIRIEHLNKYYNKGKKNEIHVIDNTSLELPDHGIVTFFGHSGSGKTTLLNAIGGLDSFTGSIQYDSTKITNYRMGRIDDFRSKNIGYVFQNYDLLLNESVYDNLLIALSIIGINDKEECKKRIEYTLKAVGLFRYRKKKAYALSGGQQQRVAIARALVKKCKILIADEPTGNLDSANTIEVMNILKSISQNTLVLLVTHEKNIADFYSDQIIEMEDGKILSVKENESNENTLQEEHSNAVYLKDMKKEEEENDSFTLTVYKEENDESKRHLDIYIKNNTIYVRSDSPLRIADEKNLQIIDDHRKVITKEQTKQECIYDNSFYDDTKKGKKGFASFKSLFLEVWHSLFGVKKKTKLLYAALVLMGLVFANSAVSYVNTSTTTLDSYAYSESYGKLDSYDYDTDVSPVLKAYDEGYINKAYSDSAMGLKYNDQITFSQSAYYYNYLTYVPYQEDKVTLKYGEGIRNENEIVVSEDYAKSIINSYLDKKEEKDLIGRTLTMDDNYTYSSDFELTIVGISENDNQFAYISEKLYYTIKKPSSYSIVHLTKEKEQGHYEVVQGRDVIEGDNKECLISEDYAQLSHFTFPISMDYEGYHVVGTFRFTNTDVEPGNSIMISNGSYNITPDDTTRYKYAYNPYYHYLVEGREPQKSTEAIASVYSNLKLNDTYNGATIVGLYSGGEGSQNSAILYSETTAAITNGMGSCIYVSNDMNAATKYFKEEYSMNFGSMSYIYDLMQKEEEFTTKTMFYITFLAIFLVASIFIFFIMRSRTLADIYTIGVYRSLGSKKRSIIVKYLLESMILTLLFTISGYIVGCVIYCLMAALINSLIGLSLIMISTLKLVIFGLIIFVLSSLVGILPIFTLLLRTPANIKRKYDI